MPRKPTATALRKAEILRTLGKVCANLRKLQKSDSARQPYKEVERLLKREVERALRTEP